MASGGASTPAICQSAGPTGRPFFPRIRRPQPLASADRVARQPSLGESVAPGARATFQAAKTQVQPRATRLTRQHHPAERSGDRQCSHKWKNIRLTCTDTRSSGTRLTTTTCGQPTCGSMNCRRWSRDSYLATSSFTPTAASTGPICRTSSKGATVFEQLIDHPAWVELVRHFIGPRHRPYIHESFLNIRGTGGYIGVHSGGHVVDSRKRKGRDQGQWCCSYLSLLVALTDVGPGDGGTVVVPGSHNSDFPHPHQDSRAGISRGPGELVEGAIEVYLKAGDALLINDFLCHGSAERTNPGERPHGHLPAMCRRSMATVSAMCRRLN